MLQNLHVRNIALIEEVDLDLGEGLNILSGETGAGKSLLLGSLNIALGGRMTQDLIRHGETEACVELSFFVDDPETEELLSEMGIETEEGCLIISRRIVSGRTVSRMNGVTVTASDIRNVTSHLLELHGQHENQTLLLPDRQLSIIDSFGADEVLAPLGELKELYRQYRECAKKLSAYETDDAARLREVSLLEYEIQEIRNAAVREGEEEELETLYRKMQHARKIIDSLVSVRDLLGDDGAAGFLGKAIRELNTALPYDESLNGISDTLSEIESLLYDAGRDAGGYLEELTFSDEDFAETEQRLDLIRSLMAKYGKTYEALTKYAEDAEERLAFLNNYEEEKSRLEEEIRRAENRLTDVCSRLSAARKKAAEAFAAKVKEQLYDLNFKKVDFQVRFEETAGFTASGKDSVSFDLSVNAGEPLRPLAKVASGGELSRIMLAIRTLLADRDGTGTLIFDEIDTGISGVTAQKVAEKMALIAGSHQLICVTHLPQIAAMADHHFVIEKESGEDSTETRVRELTGEEPVRELARMLGGMRISDAVWNNASEMKSQALEFKSAHS